MPPENLLSEEESQRIALQSVAVHRMPPGIYDYEGLHFPIDHGQVNNLLGQLLTQIEAMNLNVKAENATKAIVKQMMWRWFDEVMENAITSSNGCIAPIKIKECSCGANETCKDCRFIDGVKLVDPSIDPFEKFRPTRSDGSSSH